MLRNPIGFTISNWGNYIKNGLPMDLDEFLQNEGHQTPGHMQGSLGLLNDLSKSEMVELTTLNYSVCSGDLIGVLSKWLGVSRETWTIPGKDPVNRSLAECETRIQLAFNRVMGKDAFWLAKAFTEKLPGVKPFKPVPSIEKQQAVWERSKPWIEQLNRFMTPGHEITFDRLEPNQNGESVFTDDQLRVIAETLGGRIKQMETELNRIYDSETRIMRFIRRLADRYRNPS